MEAAAAAVAAKAVEIGELKAAASKAAAAPAPAPAPAAGGAEVAELQAKLAAAEETAEKMRKAARHWKTKHDDLKGGGAAPASQ